MRVGCGSATIGIFAQQWFGHVDEVVVVDDHITGVLSEHQAGKFLDMAPSGIRVRGRKSTPGRYFQVANPGSGWGGTDITEPLSIVESWDAKHGARPGLRLLMVSTTGEDSAWFVLDDDLVPQPAEMPAPVRRVVDRIGENCEPSLCSVLYVAGAGGSPARRRHREPGRADAIDQVAARQRHLRRRAGVRVAGRRHHGDGRRRQDAGQQLRLGADAGDRLADRVHDAPRRLPRARRPRRPRAPPRRRHRRRRLARRRAPSRACRGRCARRPEAGDERAVADRRGAAPARRRSLALPARPDRLHRRRRRRCRRGRGGDRDRVGALPDAARRARRRAARCCAPISRPARPCCRAGRSRAAWSRRAGRMRRTAASSPRWRPSPAASPRSCSAAFDDPRIARASINNGGDIALRLTPGTSFEVGVVRRSAPRRRRPAARRPLHARRVVAGARHRHLGLARPQLLARHRRQRHRPGDERRARRRGGDDRRQRGRRRRFAHRPRAGERGPRRQRPRRPPRRPRRAAAACGARRRGAGARRRRGARADRRRAHHRCRALAARPLARRRRGRCDRRHRRRIGAASMPRRTSPRRSGLLVPRAPPPFAEPPKGLACSIPPAPPPPRSTSASSSARSRTSGTTTARAWRSRCAAAASPRC